MSKTVVLIWILLVDQLLTTRYSCIRIVHVAIVCLATGLITIHVGGLYSPGGVGTVLA